MIVGYARTSTTEQIAGLDAQERDLKAAGAEKLFREQRSSVAARTTLATCLAFLREGDTLAVTKPDRLARSTKELLEIEADLSKRGIGLLVLSMGGIALDTRNPTSKLMLTILAGVATWEREIMLERQREGIAKAKGEGKYKGRQAEGRIDAGRDKGAASGWREACGDSAQLGRGPVVGLSSSWAAGLTRSSIGGRCATRLSTTSDRRHETPALVRHGPDQEVVLARWNGQGQAFVAADDPLRRALHRCWRPASDQIAAATAERMPLTLQPLPEQTAAPPSPPRNGLSGAIGEVAASDCLGQTTKASTPQSCLPIEAAGSKAVISPRSRTCSPASENTM